MTTPAAPTQPAYPEKIDGAVLKIAGVVVLGAIMSILDITVVSVALRTFQGQYSVNVPAVLAAVVLSTLPILVFYVVGRRQLVSGLTAGGVKG